MFSKATILVFALVIIMTAASCGGGSIGFIPDDNTGPELAIFGLVQDQQYGMLAAGPDVVNITAVASDDSGVASMSLRINGALVASSNSANLAYDWDSAAVPNGTYEFEFRATDTNGNVTSVMRSATAFNTILINPEIILPDLDLIFP